MIEILRKEKNTMFANELEIGDTFELDDRYYVVIDSSYDHNLNIKTDRILCFCLDSNIVTSISVHTMVYVVDIKCEIIEA